MTNIYYFIIILIFFNCSSSKEKLQHKLIPKISIVSNIVKLNDSLKETWAYKDILIDSVPGLSILKANNLSLSHKKGKEVFVAILDSEIDINHKAINNNIWINSKEIPDNNIDDDQNGYVDDINGWNFLGNTNKENIIQANFEYVRIVRKFKNLYENKEIEDFSNIIDREKFTTYLNAKKALDKKAKKAKENYDYAYKVYQQYQDAKSSLKKYFPNYKYSEIKLNNIRITNPELTSDVEFMKQFLKYGESDQSLTKQMKEFDDLLFKRVNIDFNERTILNEDTDRLSDIDYGNNILNNNLNEYSHGTKIAGLIIGDNIKIMPLCVSPYGNEHDKDIAIAIRYAADNGAKVINMSFSKNFSLFKEWVLDAIKYADKKNVLIVTSAGNDGLNINNRDNYPDDANGSGIEVSNNFLKIGATTYFVNSDLIDKYSNYGNSKVDVFAPGVDIYTTIPNNKYAYFSGTSLSAALTSKVAALIFSYYPNLSASQVKHIIMDSGVEYTFPVKTPTKEDKDKMTPFNELSKSGRIVNAYNALLMAERVSNANKKKRD